ncbi:unnamed protein product, partial [Mesorhabditis spiculigera]
MWIFGTNLESENMTTIHTHYDCCNCHKPFELTKLFICASDGDDLGVEKLLTKLWCQECGRTHDDHHRTARRTLVNIVLQKSEKLRDIFMGRTTVYLNEIEKAFGLYKETLGKQYAALDQASDNDALLHMNKALEGMKKAERYLGQLAGTRDYFRFGKKHGLLPVESYSANITNGSATNIPQEYSIEKLLEFSEKVEKDLKAMRLHGPDKAKIVINEAKKRVRISPRVEQVSFDSDADEDEQEINDPEEPKPDEILVHTPPPQHNPWNTSPFPPPPPQIPSSPIATGSRTDAFQQGFPTHAEKTPSSKRDLIQKCLPDFLPPKFGQFKEPAPFSQPVNIVPIGYGHQPAYMTPFDGFPQIQPMLVPAPIAYDYQAEAYRKELKRGYLSPRFLQITDLNFNDEHHLTMLVSTSADVAMLIRFEEWDPRGSGSKINFPHQPDPRPYYKMAFEAFPHESYKIDIDFSQAGHVLKYYSQQNNQHYGYVRISAKSRLSDPDAKYSMAYVTVLLKFDGNCWIPSLSPDPPSDHYKYRKK